MANENNKSSDIAPLLKHVRSLRADAVIGKKKHYNAADRKDALNVWFGVPPVLINILLGSLFFGILAEAVPDWMKWAGAIFAFVAAVLVGIQTFFNWPKVVEGHRRVASKYLSLSKDCTALLALCETNHVPKNIQEHLEGLGERYKEITLDADAFGTSKSDFNKAIAGIKAGEEKYTALELGLDPTDTNALHQTL